jgi:uncharacterized membrane protein
MTNFQQLPRWQKLILSLCFLGGFAVLAGWLRYTPPGLLGKADAIGYAFCHRIDLRSFGIGDRPMPLCARCTGMYLGAVLTFAVLLASGRKRYSEFPVRSVLAILGVGLVAFGVDGVNSMFSLLPSLPSLYTPTNILRITTGFPMGVGMASLLFPVLAGSFWRDWTAEPVLANVRELAQILGLCGLVGLLVVMQVPLLNAVLAVLSSLGVFLLLGIINLVIVLNILNCNNQFESPMQAVWLIVLALLLTIAQIALANLIRFQLTHTWGGFVFG